MTGYEIRNLRKRKNMSQEDVAKQAGITRQAVSAIETSTRDGRISTLNAIGQVFGFRVVIQWCEPKLR